MTLVLGLTLTAAAGAGAATRFAAPGATGGAKSACPAANPCSLFAAAADIPETALRAGDEVVLAPGRYSDAAGDLGPQKSVTLLPGISLHGAAGQPRPVIANAADPNVFTGLFVQAGDVVSHLEIQSGLLSGISVRDGVVDGVVVRADAAFASACSQTSGTIRNTACLSSGPFGSAVSVSNITTGSALSPRLRGVTAIATGANSIGVAGTATNGAQLGLDAKAVIAQGRARDVRASAAGVPSRAVLDFQGSDYDSVLESPEGGGMATVTVPGFGNNITAAPTLAADGFHQLPGSPTIDKGVADAFSAPTDIDGQSRAIGGLPDIGADELANPTRAALACVSAEVAVGAPLACTVTIEDTSANPTPPAGPVVLAGDHGGSFDPGSARCQLQTSGPSASSCQFAFFPSAPGAQTVLAEYLSAGSHDASQASAAVSAFPRHETETSLSCRAEARGGASCTATVTDSSPTFSVPGGRVAFASGGKGIFGGGGSCTLVADGADRASCTVAYSPSQPGAHRISASYSGDFNHLPSQKAVSVELGSGGSSAPNTVLKRKPAKKTAQRRARFSFVAKPRGTSFQCRLDRGRFKPCRSPFTKTVKPGRHTFQVRAIGGGGSADPTPASFRWTVS